MKDVLLYGLQAAAIGQIALALLNFFLPTLLAWKEDVEKLSKLPREVFYVHAWFISITVGLFGILTWRFAEDFVNGTEPIALWLTTGIGIFWSIRLVLQWTYYSWSHWLGHGPKTFAHFFFTFIYAGWAIGYLLAGRLG